MGKPSGKKKQLDRQNSDSKQKNKQLDRQISDSKQKNKLLERQASDAKTKQHNKFGETKSKSFDENEIALIMNMSHELKEEGNKLFQKRDHQGAMLKYEKALKLLSNDYADKEHIADLHSNMAQCFMLMGSGDYQRAINECDLALDACPKYSKALLKRAKCFESLNRLEMALKDVHLVLTTEPDNLTASEVAERIKKRLEKEGISVDNKGMMILASECKDSTFHNKTADKMKTRKRGNNKKTSKENNVNLETSVEKRKPDTGLLKLVCGEDIRWAHVTPDCSLKDLMEIVRQRFPSINSCLIKYRDHEGDMVTITSSQEIRMAEASAAANQASVKLYIIQVDSDEVELSMVNETDNVVEMQSTFVGNDVEMSTISELHHNFKSDIVQGSSINPNEWVLQFARLFKNHVGFDSIEYIDFHELGTKAYNKALEDSTPREEARVLFEVAEDKFLEMSAISLFNWGNVHMSRARKRVVFTEDVSQESMLSHVTDSYDWAKEEYRKAGLRYEEALRIKPDFYEACFALSLQQFEEAKLSWYFAVGSRMCLESWSSSEVFDLLDMAEDNMEKGVQLWDEKELQRVQGSPTREKKTALLNAVIGASVLNTSIQDFSERADNVISQINILWGTILYERSVIEYKLGLHIWEFCLEAAIEKFQLGGASPTDIAVMIKNHCSNETAIIGLGFNISEIVQAWNEMYDVKRWTSGNASFRLEPLLRRKSLKLHHILEHM